MLLVVLGIIKLFALQLVIEFTVASKRAAEPHTGTDTPGSLSKCEIEYDIIEGVILNGCLAVSSA